MSTKLVPAGRFIGYGTSFLAERDLRVATVPVGYACGFARSLSNRGRVLVRGRRAAVIGVVNMSCMLINVTSIPEAQRGDEVVLIGNQGRLSITVGSFVEFANLLNYEMLCRLPASIPRTVVP
jgi:alanine racemase